MTTQEKRKKQLDQLIDYYTSGNKTAFATLLGMTPQGLSNWTKRGTFDASLLYEKLKNVSPSWLLTGDGDMIETNGDQIPQNITTREGSNMSLYSPNSFQYYNRGQCTQIDEVIQRLHKQIEEKDKQIEEKDRQLRAKDDQIQTLLNIITTQK